MRDVYPCGGAHYFDRSGQPLKLLEWADLHKGNRVVAQDVVGDFKVLTMWHGHEPGWDFGCPKHDRLPRIFGSILYQGDSTVSNSEVLSEDERGALNAHASLVGLATKLNDAEGQS